MDRFDVAIIGTGPAGLEAAITAKVRGKSVLLLGSALNSAKVEKAHAVQNYLGLPEISGAAMAEAFANHLKAMDIAITVDRINAVYAMGDYFALQAAVNMYEARALILATGVTASKPLPGELENLGRGVSYCATCDAALYRGKTAAVIAYSEREEEEAAFLCETAREVLYIMQYSGSPRLPENARVLAEKPVSVEKAEGGMLLTTDAGAHTVDGVFILRDSILPNQLVPGLQTEAERVVVDREMATNIPGCFACGDITGRPYQYIKAAGEGNVAALSAVKYLAAQAK